MNKIKILCLSIWYPLSMSRYFEKAFRHHPNVDFKTTGPYTGSWIPWMGGMNLPEKYAKPPDVPLPFNGEVGRVSYDLAKAQLGDWKPDIVLSIDAGINWINKPHEGLVTTIATDPHALDYDHQRRISDKFFNMQASYSKPQDIYLPYAYSKYDCYPDDTVKKDADAVLIGMPYEQRVQWVEALRRRDVSVIFQNGPVFDEARDLYNRGRIGLNWSSLDDLNCRAFEIPAMKLFPIMNSVSDLHKFKFYQDTLVFYDIAGAVEKVMWAIEHPENVKLLAKSAYEHVQGETYDSRVDQFLQECGYA
jgi:hypothetical protein